MIPRYIALCGNPKAGKSTVQQILLDYYGVEPVDDGAPMREFAMKNLGLTYDQVHTQAGKLEHVEILGRRWQVRELLGVLGNHFEAMFGPHAMPHMAVERVKDEPGRFSFGSVRRDQGRYYQERGGIVLGILNPLAGPSDYEFDRFDHAVVDAWILNDFQHKGISDPKGKELLAERVNDTLGKLIRARAA